ncbi:DinB family protein [Hymenobacter chitinivorans]|uniref:Putative damage-inducible protein DinB n=1 Tax=Hymenobacter chitinivorans DSM 11115 TaxID=1121954 RepID=A0A2M9BT05_9BACT|nr:DinB family protein [Hymenobacter chitinivorans]PJJ61032.1 putative damage-inducible protein DinB [Hymenobacter chitinivorans DSM 11115]
MDHATRLTLVTELRHLLEKGFAHGALEDACAGIPADKLNQRLPQVPYTIWELVEHIRIAQYDILDFSRNPAYETLDWPAAYWPDPAQPADEAAFQRTVQQISHDREEFLQLLQDPALDLLAPFPHGTGQSLLREAMLIADHNSYHLGQLILLRRLLGIWE